jgi:hypothetical protein
MQVGVKHAYVLALNRVYVITVAAGQLRVSLSRSRFSEDRSLIISDLKTLGGLSSLSALLIRNVSIKGKAVMAGGA